MFKSREEYIQAMLEGRKFLYKTHISRWDGLHFLTGERIQNIFDYYNKVTEILPEPNIGDSVLVWNIQEEYCFKVIFIGMFNEYYMCKFFDEDNDNPTAWKNAKTIEGD